MVSIRQASAESGISRQRLTRALNEGRMSGRKIDGRWEIDPSELVRAFPDARAPSAPEAPPADPGSASALGAASPDSRAAIAEARVEELQAQLRRQDETLADLRGRLDRSEERVFALSAPPAPAPEGILTRLRRWLR